MPSADLSVEPADTLTPVSSESATAEVFATIVLPATEYELLAGPVCVYLS